ncbi:cuticle protein 19-like [Schistocerca serialis cubense]|uniref:cuticle protein 19-like n=1 Tax=Schistocerca serialis cubense TaxID=2023355 RepID=UPI00214F44B0|nr:cuticle protein 19-like [Schistocerca serialis cubense]
MTVAALIMLASFTTAAAITQTSGHYSTFSGPVSGAIRQVVANPRGAVDFVAKPDYSFAFGVEDPESGNAQAHEERRDGGVVKGQYTLLEPDGRTRTVVYTADPEHGFRADVTFSGTAITQPSNGGSNNNNHNYYY